jgi:hypothetical protein
MHDRCSSRFRCVSIDAGYFRDDDNAIQCSHGVASKPRHHPKIYRAGYVAAYMNSTCLTTFVKACSLAYNVSLHQVAELHLVCRESDNALRPGGQQLVPCHPCTYDMTRIPRIGRRM